MGKTDKRGKTGSSAYDVERAAAIMSARQQFVSSSFNMGWQLLLTVLVPVIIGVKLDDHFKTTPSYTLAALVIATFCAVMVVWNTVKRANKRSMAKEAR